MASFLLLLAASDGAPSGAVDVHVEGMRSQKGLIHACLTRESRYFPHCDEDATSRRISVPTREGSVLHFRNVSPGDYAITVLHDENGNSKADMFLGIPKEGVGFSNNPRIIAGPPSFASARFHVGDQSVSESIRLKYFL